MEKYIFTIVFLVINYWSDSCVLASLKHPKNCGQIDPSDRNVDQLTYTIFPQDTVHSITVQCDFETDGGNWTVIQQRGGGGPMDEFYLDWSAYDEGFGDVQNGGNYWLGLKNIYALTSTFAADQQQQELRVELGDWENKTWFAQYNLFSVSNSTDLYRLTIGGLYDGDVEDALAYHNGVPFSTRDVDNDLDPERHCAQTFHGAWWYNACYESNLNGFYFANGSSPNFDGVAWGEEWDSPVRSGYSLKTVQMKIRDYVAQ